MGHGTLREHTSNSLARETLFTTQMNISHREVACIMPNDEAVEGTRRPGSDSFRRYILWEDAVAALCKS